MSVCTRRDGRGEDRGQRADDGDRLHRGGREHEQSIRTRNHVDSRRHHGRGMDERGNRCGAFHGVGQPDVERKLRRLAAGSDEEQQSGRGDDGIADGEASAVRNVRDFREAEGSEVPGDEEHSQQKSGVADAVHDEGFVSGISRRFAMEVETD